MEGKEAMRIFSLGLGNVGDSSCSIGFYFRRRCLFGKLKGRSGSWGRLWFTPPKSGERRLDGDDDQ